MMNFVLKTWSRWSEGCQAQGKGGICIKTDIFYIWNDGFSIRNDGFCIQNDDIFKADATGVKEVAGTAVGKMTRVKLTRPAVDGKKKV